MMNFRDIKQSKLIYFILYNVDLIIFCYIIFLKLMMYAKQISPEYLYTKVSYPIFASILILTSFTLFLNKNKRATILFSMNLIISLVLLSDIIYFKYFKDVTTVAALKNIKLLGGVSSSVSSLIGLKDFLYLVDVIFLIPILKIYRKFCTTDKKNLISRLCIFSFMFIVGLAININCVYAVAKDQPTLLTSMSNRIYLTKMIGNLNFHAVDVFNYVTTNIKNSKKLPTERKEEIKAFLRENNKDIGISLKGEGSGKNLIVIQVEALQQFVINQKVNGEEITPNLNKWINKSLYFDNYFYQVAGGNTSDAEFMSNNSLYPAESGAAYNTYSGNYYESLAKQLTDKDYYTAAMHGNNEGFWNRNVMYKAEGFEDFYGEHSFNIDEEVGLGLSDKSFLNQSFEKIKTFKEPYYSFVVTLSSHHPYDDVKGYGDFNVGEYDNSLLGNYLKAIHYTDEQLGIFLDKLEKEGTLNDSIVVIYGDHFAIPKEQIDELYKFENVSNPNDLTWFEYQKVPLVIHFPEDKHKGVNHTYSGQMDLYPTLSNIFNLSKNYMFGKDIINSNSNKVVFRNGSFTDGNTFYISWTNTYYDIKTGNVIKETEDLKNSKDEAVKELQYSDDLLNQNLLKTLKEEIRLTLK